MPRVVISGAPGAGKTTLLAALGSLGHITVTESAREVIAERLARGETPRPRPEAFAREVYRRDMQKYFAHPDAGELVFFDRCAIESLGMVHEVQPLSPAALRAELHTFSFHHTVFLLPPWEEIYRTDAERDDNFAHAVQVHERLLNWYAKCGFSVHQVPRISVSERARHVLHALSAA